jgi:hypothetical protein
MHPNREEQLIIDNLTFQGYKKIEFEPDGNVPPDILVDNMIAIEVRRLNQNQVIGDGFQGLEQDEYTIYGLLRKIMDDVSDENFDRSAFVGFFFNRPLPDKKEVKKKVTDILVNHKTHMSEHKEYKVSDNFKLKIFPSSNKLQKQYQYGISSDGDTGGFVVGLIHKNLQLIIKEKEDKTRSFKLKYPEWWLAVVDTIGYGLTDLDLEHFYELPKIIHDFDRILLVSPLDKKRFNYLYE